MTPSGHRLPWIDSAKGVGIILVVVAHVLLGSQAASARSTANAIYSFHMPLFFILAGFTLQRQEPLGFALRKISVFGLPYLAFLATLGIPALVLSCGLNAPQLALGIDRCPVLAIKLVSGGSLLTGIFGVFWFVPCLFGGLVIAQLVLSAKSGRVRVLMSVLLIVAAYGLPSLSPWTTSVLSLGSAPMAGVLILTGHWLAQAATGWARSPALLAGCVAVGLLTLWTKPGFDFKFADFGIPLLSLAGAVALSCLVIATSKQIISAPVLAGSLGYIGRCTLTVMYLHQSVHLGLRVVGLHHDAALISLSLAIPLLLHSLIDNGLGRLARHNLFDLSRKSPLLERPLK